MTRSAWGLAATVVVAGVAAPAIGGRAGAASVADAEPANGLAEAASAVTVAQQLEIEAAAPRHFDPPPLAELIDHLDRNEPERTFAVAEVSAGEPAPEEFVAASITSAPIETDIKPYTTVAVVADAGQPKGGSAPQDAAGRPRVSLEIKPSA